MNELQRFINGHKLSRYTMLLDANPDADARELLQVLAEEQHSRFVAPADRLQAVGAVLAAVEARLSVQRRLVERLRHRGADVAAAAEALRRLEETKRRVDGLAAAIGVEPCAAGADPQCAGESASSHG